MPWFKKVWVPAPNTLQLEMVYQTNGGMAENVYHIQGTGTVTDLALLAGKIADAALAWETAKGAALRSNFVALKTIRVRDIGQPDGFAIERSVSVIGARVAQACPDNVTVAIKWVTGRAGRSYRGRTYHVGFTVDMHAGDTLTAPIQAAMLDAYNDLRTRMHNLDVLNTGLASADLSIVSISHNHTARGTAVVTPVTAAVLSDPYIDSQRRRLFSRGK